MMARSLAWFTLRTAIAVNLLMAAWALTGWPGAISLLCLFIGIQLHF